jgi:hypothetical protein
MPSIPFNLEELLEDFPTVDLLAHPQSIEGRWEAVLILSEDGDSLFLRKGKPLTSFLYEVKNSCRTAAPEETEAWLDEAGEGQDLIVILGNSCESDFRG